MDLIERRLAESEQFRLNFGRPLVTLSYSQSLDGSIAPQRGQPPALSGRASQTYTHWLRSQHDAILIGVGTVISDNPRLNVRLIKGHDPQPVVLDGRLRFPPQSRLLSPGRKPPWIATTRAAPTQRRKMLEEAGARLLYLPGDEAARILLPGLLERLGNLGINSVLVEGGAMVITSFLAERLVDQIIVSIAPVFLGGLHAVDNLSYEASEEVTGEWQFSPGAGSLFPRLADWDCRRFGADLLVWGIPEW